MNGTMVRYGSTDVEADRKRHHARVQLHKRGDRKMTGTMVRYGSTDAEDRK